MLAFLSQRAGASPPSARVAARIHRARSLPPHRPTAPGARQLPGRVQHRRQGGLGGRERGRRLSGLGQPRPGPRRIPYGPLADVKGCDRNEAARVCTCTASQCTPKQAWLCLDNFDISSRFCNVELNFKVLNEL